MFSRTRVVATSRFGSVVAACGSRALFPFSARPVARCARRTPLSSFPAQTRIFFNSRALIFSRADAHPICRLPDAAIPALYRQREARAATQTLPAIPPRLAHDLAGDLARSRAISSVISPFPPSVHGSCIVDRVREISANISANISSNISANLAGDPPRRVCVQQDAARADASEGALNHACNGHFYVSHLARAF